LYGGFETKNCPDDDSKRSKLGAGRSTEQSAIRKILSDLLSEPVIYAKKLLPAVTAGSNPGLDFFILLTGVRPVLHRAPFPVKRAFADYQRNCTG
jgi:hypothetical protein